MKYLRFEANGEMHFGVLSGTKVTRLSGSYFGPMVPGDVVEVRIDNVGTLRNGVARTEG